MTERTLERTFAMARLVLRLFVALVAILGTGSARAEKAALVIGNAAYQGLTPLANPVNDAEDMAAALGRLGYRVVLVKDGDLARMSEGVRAFLRAAEGAESAVLYYSGHGVQADGRNYLVPVSARIVDNLDLDTQALALDKLLEFLDAAGARVKIVILDSCRDNPLPRLLVRGGGTRGLARVELDARTAKGTLIAFATAPGAVAEDGSGRHSPFTAALLKHVETPDLDIRQMLGKVRADVDEATQGAQTPWVNEAIIGSFAMAGQGQGNGAVERIGTGNERRPIQPSQQRGFIFADSDVRLLGHEELSGLSPAELRIARNEIFARRGRYMKDDQLRSYFSQFPWYSPFTWTPSLNAIEKANVSLIQEAEGSR
jgi:hypothetical protein